LWDIFNHDPSGLKTAKDSIEFGPEPAVVFDAELLTGLAGGLAGEPPANEVDRLKVSWVDLFDVSIAFHSRPVAFQHTGAVLMNLDLPGRLHAGPLQAEVKATDTGKERAKPHPVARSTAAATLRSGFGS
jgi:hypothetical protein